MCDELALPVSFNLVSRRSLDTQVEETNLPSDRSREPSLLVLPPYEQKEIKCEKGGCKDGHEKWCVCGSSSSTRDQRGGDMYTLLHLNVFPRHTWKSERAKSKGRILVLSGMNMAVSEALFGVPFHSYGQTLRCMMLFISLCVLSGMSMEHPLTSIRDCYRSLVSPTSLAFYYIVLRSTIFSYKGN